MASGILGATTPSYKGTKTNPLQPGSIKVRISEDVKLFSPDPETGEYSLNHEAGHFLYIATYTSQYVKYYFKEVANGTYVEGGHGATDESGKVATKYGQMKDLPSPAPKILPTGN